MTERKIGLESTFMAWSTLQISTVGLYVRKSPYVYEMHKNKKVPRKILLHKKYELNDINIKGKVFRGSFTAFFTHKEQNYRISIIFYYCQLTQSTISMLIGKM